jgi:hypothetical protein
MTIFPKFFNREEAAAYLADKWGVRMAPATLAKKATVGGGPPFRRDGRFPVYSDAGLDAWAQQRLGSEVRSTAEYRAAAPKQPSRAGHKMPDRAEGTNRSEGI